MNSLELVVDALYKNYNVKLDNYDNMPVDVDFENLDNSRMIITKELTERLNNIALTTKTLDKEIGFIMYGKEYIENQVLFDSITISDGLLRSDTTEFGPEITEELKNIIKDNLDERTVICYGHSHPNISEDYKFFSVSDLASLVELTQKNEEIKNKHIQLIGCLVTEDIKFIYYDPTLNNFYDVVNIEYQQ